MEASRDALTSVPVLDPPSVVACFIMVPPSGHSLCLLHSHPLLASLLRSLFEIHGVRHGSCFPTTPPLLPSMGVPPPGFHASVPKPQFITHDPRFQSQLPCGPSHSSPFKPPRSRSPHNESISSVSIICVSLLYGHGVYVGGSLPTCERCTILVPWCVPNVVSPTHTRQPLQVNLFECGVVFPYQ